MKDKFIRKYSDQLPDDILNRCPEFAPEPGSAGKEARGSQGNRGWLKGALVPLTVALVGAAAVMTVVLVSRNRKDQHTGNEHTVSVTTPDPTVAFTDNMITLVPEDPTEAKTEPALTATASLTASPEQTSTPSSTTTVSPSQTPGLTPTATETVRTEEPTPTKTPTPEWTPRPTPAPTPADPDPSQISKAEAIWLVRNGMDIINSSDWAFQWFRGGTNYRNHDVGEDLTFVDNDTGLHTYYRRVLDGYDEEGVRELVKATFTSELAEKYGWTTDNYLVTDDGKVYYRARFSAQTWGYTPFTISEEDLDNIVIDGKNTAWFRADYSGEYDERELEVVIYCTFAFEDGHWKLAGLNDADAVLTEYDSDFALEGEALNKDDVVRALDTVLYDVYQLTHMSGEFLRETKLIDEAAGKTPGTIWSGPIKFYRVMGTLSDAGIWEAYAKRFTTDEMAERLLDGRCMKFVDGYAYYRSGSYGSEVILPWYFNFDEMEISYDGDKAVAVLPEMAGRHDAIIERSGNNDYPGYATVKFLKAGGVWKICGGTLFDLLDSSFLNPGLEPYPADADEASIPDPVPYTRRPFYDSLLAYSSLNDPEKSCDWVKTYKEVHLKAGETLIIPVLLFKALPMGSFSVEISFGDSQAILYRLGDNVNTAGVEALYGGPGSLSGNTVTFANLDCSADPLIWFTVTGLEPGEATVHIYSQSLLSMIPEELQNSWIKRSNGVLADLDLKIIVE
jgi:hypothetical protein